MNAHSAKPTEVDRNFEEFRKLLPKLLKTAPGKFVVMHDGKIVETFDTYGDAVRAGYSKFGPDKFSVQEVTSGNINLGYHSYALYQHTD